MTPHSIINSGQMGLGIGGKEADMDTTYFQKAALGLLRGTQGTARPVQLRDPWPREGQLLPT